MEFDIDIHTGLNGKITIEDYSLEYDQYFPENQIVQEYGRYKYSECKTLNVVMKINTDKIILTDVLLHDHDQLVEDPTEPGSYIYDLETTDFTVKRDGYYNVHHMVLPTMDWFTNTYLKQDEEYRKAFSYEEYLKTLEGIDFETFDMKEIKIKAENTYIATMVYEKAGEKTETDYLLYLNHINPLTIQTQIDYECNLYDGLIVYVTSSLFG